MNSTWLDHPAVQGGGAPLVVALIVAAALNRTRFAWLAIVAGYLVMLVLSGDFSFDPLTAGRKLTLVGLASALIGVAVDALAKNARRHLPTVLSGIAALLAAWVFLSILRQREGTQLVLTAVGILLFVGVLVRLVLALRHDGIRSGAAGLGLGLATGVAGVLSASIGYLLGGVAVAAASGAMLVVQLVTRRELPAGYAGALSIGVLTAYFAAATLLLAQLPWYALPLLCAIPLSLWLPLPSSTRFGRAAIASCYALAAALLPIAAAWYAARG